jgi:hypothetical protein
MSDAEKISNRRTMRPRRIKEGSAEKVVGRKLATRRVLVASPFMSSLMMNFRMLLKKRQWRRLSTNFKFQEPECGAECPASTI